MPDMKKRTFLKYASVTALTGASGLLLGCGESKETAKPTTPTEGTTLPAPTTSGTPAVTPASAPLKVAFVYIGPVGDGGWSYSHDLGRKHVESVFGNKIETSYVESVTENDAERVFRSLVDQGNQLIFGGTYGYMTPMQKVANENPSLFFEHCTGTKTLKNMRTYDHRLYEAAFQAGVVAAHLTKTKVLGFVGTFPIAEVLRNVNAYTLGARSVDPSIIVKTAMTNSWYNPTQETIYANTLLSAGADILLQNTDSSAVLQAAAKAGKFAFGWDSDMSNYAPEAHLGSCVLNWGIYYEKSINDVLNGTWKEESIRWGEKEGLVKFANISNKVQGDVKTRLAEVQTGLMNGTFNVFAGPIVDNKGQERLAAGKVADVEWENKVDFFVEGVNAS